MRPITSIIGFVVIASVTAFGYSVVAEYEQSEIFEVNMTHVVSTFTFEIYVWATFILLWDRERRSLMLHTWWASIGIFIDICLIVYLEVFLNAVSDVPKLEMTPLLIFHIVVSAILVFVCYPAVVLLGRALAPDDMIWFPRWRWKLANNHSRWRRVHLCAGFATLLFSFLSCLSAPHFVLALIFAG